MSPAVLAPSVVFLISRERESSLLGFIRQARGETPHLKPESCSDVSRLPCSLRGVCLRSDVRAGSLLGYFLVALAGGDVGGS